MAVQNRALLLAALISAIIIAEDRNHLANGEMLMLSGEVEYNDIKYVATEAKSHIRTKRQTSSFISSILYKLNSIRRQCQASNMFQMEWEDSLAQPAAYWANRCVWEKNYPYSLYPLRDGTTVSSVMFATTTSTIDTDDAFDRNYQECSYYNISGPCMPGEVCGTCADGRNCSSCTQLLWASSYRVACATSRCSTVQGLTWKDVSMMVCYYTPGGNIIGQYPYIRGPPCSQCGPYPNRYYCQNSLCCHQPVDTTTTQTTTTTTTTSSTTTSSTTTSSTTASSTTMSSTTSSSTITSSTTTQTTTTTTATTASTDSTTNPTSNPTTNPSSDSTSDSTTATTTTTNPTSDTTTSSTITSSTTTSSTTTSSTTTSSTTTSSTATSSTTTATTTTATTTSTTTSSTTTSTTTGTDTTTTAALTTQAPNACGSSSCPNGCQLNGQLCCSCKTFNYYRDCTCCPTGYQCCPASPFYPNGAGCCPSGSTCMGDGSCSFLYDSRTYYFPARGVNYYRTLACQTDPMLVITASDFFDEFYFNGSPVPLSMFPNSYYPDMLDIIPLPAGTTLIAVRIVNSYSWGGLLVRSTDGQISATSAWRCMDYSYSLPPSNWMLLSFDDSAWPLATTYSYYGVVRYGYPYYSLAPIDQSIGWTWISPSLGPGRYVYCRLTL